MTTTGTPTPRPSGKRGKTQQRRSRMTTSATTTRRRASAPPTAPPRAPVSARMRYRFDNAMARGPMVVIAYLGAVSALVILISAIVATAASFTFGGGRDGSFTEGLWQAMLRTLDAGSFAADSAWPTRVLGLLITILGIFVAGSLIGLIANAVDQKVEELRRGHNPVIESGHTLILGWSPQVPRIIAELVIANESEREASVVVLARADKAAMEEDLRERVGDTRTTRLVCRSGNPALPADLERASIAHARSIVVVRDDDGDAGVIKAVLAARALDPALERAHVVCELADAENARIIRSATDGRVLTVSSDDVVAEVTAQACIRSGLAAVFTDLLDFDGDEIYFSAVPELAGCRYSDALTAFDTSSVIGRVRVDDGTVELNPPADTVLGDGDRLILVAADDSAITFNGIRAAEAIAPPEQSDPAPEPLRITMVGWSSFGLKVLRELDEFLPAGSRIDVVVDSELADAATVPRSGLSHAQVKVHAGADGMAELLRLADADPPDQVIVLGYRDTLSVDDADARTLLTLLTLRQVFPADDPDHVRVVAELLDQRNLVLADPVGVDDLIVSDALSSLLIAQLSEHAELQAVFDDLFDADGAVIDLVPVQRITSSPSPTWPQTVAAAAALDMSAFGVRRAADSVVVLNPAKRSTWTLDPADDVVVLTSR